MVCIGVVVCFVCVVFCFVVCGAVLSRVCVCYGGVRFVVCGLWLAVCSLCCVCRGLLCVFAWCVLRFAVCFVVCMCHVSFRCLCFVLCGGVCVLVWFGVGVGFGLDWL